MTEPEFHLSDRRRTPLQKLFSEILSVLSVVFSAVLLAVIITTYFFHTVYVDGTSMVPTLRDRQTVWVTKIFKVERGDIVVFPCNDKELFADVPFVWGKDLIKRAVGLEGDTLYTESRQGKLCMIRLESDGTETVLARGLSSAKQIRVVVPEGRVFVMGDNFNDSTDSRVFGPIPLDIISGEALFVK